MPHVAVELEGEEDGGPRHVDPVVALAGDVTFDLGER